MSKRFTDNISLNYNYLNIDNRYHNQTSLDFSKQNNVCFDMFASMLCFTGMLIVSTVEIIINTPPFNFKKIHILAFIYIMIYNITIVIVYKCKFLTTCSFTIETQLLT